MSRKRKIILGIVGVLVLTISALLFYLEFSDLSGWRDTVARFASNAMARKLTIAGDFEVDLGLVTRVRATDVSLANTEWGSEPDMASIESLDGEIDLRALFSGSIHLPHIEIEGGRAVFESSPEAGSNWALGKGEGDGEGGPVRLRIDSINAREVELIFRSPSVERAWDVSVASLESTGDDTGLQSLVGKGLIRGTPFGIRGSFGSLESLVNLGTVDHDLDLELSSATLSSAGTIAELATLTGLDLQAEASVSEPTEITDLLDLPESPLGALTAKVTAAPESDLTAFTLAINGRAADLHAEGTVDSLIHPTDLDIELLFEGPDIRPVAQLVGAGEFPERPFNVAGKVRWQGFPVEITGFEMRVGDNTVTADGRLGKPPLMLGTDFRFRGSGPNIAAVAVLTGRRFPHDAYELEGRLRRVENGLDVGDVSARLGATSLIANGFVGDPPDYNDTELDLDVRGPDLGRYSRAVGMKLPHQPFRIAGRLAQGDNAIALSDVKATLGNGRVDVDGRLTTVPGFIGTDLRFATDGLDVLHIGEMLGVDGLPSSPLRAEGRVIVAADGYRPHNVRGRLADVDCTVSGLITRNKKLVGTSLTIEAKGGDASIFSNLVPKVSLPHEEFQVGGTLELLPHAFRLREVAFELGGVSGAVNGEIGDGSTSDGTHLEFEAHGPSLADLDPLVPRVRLPAGEFTATGGVTVGDGLIGLDGLSLDVAGNSISIDGSVAPVEGLIGSSFEASIEGRSLGDLGTLVESALATEIPDLPDKAYSAGAELTVDEVGFHLPDLKASLGSAQVSVNGTVGHGPDFNGSDIEVEADGPDASMANSLIGFDFPVEPFSITGGVAKDANGIVFRRVQATFASYLAAVDGRLGPLPKLIGTDLRVDVGGPNLELVKKLAGLEWVPSQPWGFSGRFDGDPSRFNAHIIVLRIGESDVSGDIRVDLEGKPEIVAHLSSDLLSLTDLLSTRREIDSPAENTDDEPVEERQFVVSDKPWDLSFLEPINVDLDWEMGEFEYLRAEDQNVELSLALDDGHLRVDRLRGTGALDGTIDGNAALIPVPEGHRIELEFHIDDGMVNLAGEGADPSQYTPGDVHISMSGVGRTPHELMASANGSAVLTIEGGLMEKGVLDVISADVLVTLLNALNPFAKDESHTNLNCAVLAATFTDGVMKLEPVAIQTDKVTVLGDGTIDFETEHLRVDWVTKPRKGIGISASMFTNPYIRLGGTMADPALEMKPVEALATTGVAVVTMGISLVAKGLWDRVTAEKKVCEKAMKEVGEMEAGGAKK